MELYGIEVNLNSIPELEKDFVPVLLWNKAYLAKARENLTLVITAPNKHRIVHRTRIRNDGASKEADEFFLDRLVKALLWLHGGSKVTVIGSKTMFQFIKNKFSFSGDRSFEIDFMSTIYDTPFLVENITAVPKEQLNSKFIGHHLNGYRIGIDVNEFDRKACAIANGKVLYSEEVLWHPLEEEDPDFHFKAIVESIHAAARRLPRIDAIGISTSGIFMDGKLKKSPIFAAVNQEDYEKQISNLYQRAAKSMGSENIEVLSEGDVAALAGAMSLDAKGVLSVHFGQRLTAGFLDNNGNLTGWLNELSYVPVNLNPQGDPDETTQDRGCGAHYFSEEGVIAMGKKAGILIDENASLKEQLRSVQIQAEQGTSKGKFVFQTIGTILGHSLAYYHGLYNYQMVLLMGRVMLGVGGDIIFNATQKVLTKDYPVIASNIVISLPDENNNRVSQAEAAASAPEC